MSSSARPRSIAVVAGAAGFIGRSLVERLSVDHDVVGVGRGTATPRIDVSALRSLPTPALIVCAAGPSSVSRSFEAPLVDCEETLSPLMHLLEWARSCAPLPRIVLLSSAAVYGDAADFPTPESAPRAPVSPYGVHRALAEDLLAGWSRAFGLPAVTVRLFSVYGEGLRRQLLWDACRRARRGEHAFAGTGIEERDWLHVTDAVSLIVRAADEAAAAMPVFNGGTGAGRSVQAIVARIFERLAASAPTFTGARRAGDPLRMVADVRKAHALGWAPRVKLDDGIDAYVRWAEAHL